MRASCPPVALGAVSLVCLWVRGAPGLFPWTWVLSAGGPEGLPPGDPGLRVALQRAGHPAGCNSLRQLQGREVPPSSPWRCHTITEAGLCPPQARPVCHVCGLSAAASQAALSPGPLGRRAAPAGPARPLSLACGLPALWPPSGGIQGAEGAAPPGSPTCAAVLWTGGQGGSFPLLGGPSGEATRAGQEAQGQCGAHWPRTRLGLMYLGPGRASSGRFSLLQGPTGSEALNLR